MRAFWGSKKKQPQIDLAAIRDTLLYIESDLIRSPEHTDILKSVQDALQNLERRSENTAADQIPNNVVYFHPANL